MWLLIGLITLVLIVITMDIIGLYKDESENRKTALLLSAIASVGLAAVMVFCS